MISSRDLRSSVAQIFIALVTFVIALLGGSAHAEIVPPRIELPHVLSLEEALHIFRAKGFDLLIADAAVTSAEGDRRIAGAVPNPIGNVGYGRVFGYDPNALDATGNPQCASGGCSANQWTAGLSDNAAIVDSLSGKRSLRIDVAKAALSAAKMNRVDAERTLELQIKQQYAQVALAAAALDFAKEAQVSNQQTLGEAAIAADARAAIWLCPEPLTRRTRTSRTPVGSRVGIDGATAFAIERRRLAQKRSVDGLKPRPSAYCSAVRPLVCQSRTRSAHFASVAVMPAGCDYAEHRGRRGSCSGYISRAPLS